MIQQSRRVKHLLVVLSVPPSQGGKFQYSLSLLQGLCSLDAGTYRITALISDKNWLDRVPDLRNATPVLCKSSRTSRVVRRLVRSTPRGTEVWRRCSHTLDHAAEALRDLRPDLAFFPGVDALAYEVDVPSVVSVHDLMHRYETRFAETRANGVYETRERHYRNICKYAAGVLVDSRVGRKQFLESYEFPREKVFVLPYVKPHYIDLHRAHPTKPRGAVPDRYIFYPAQSWAHKNHRGILEAMAVLNAAGLEVNAVFSGLTEDESHTLRGVIARLGLAGQVFWAGYVTEAELVWLYQNAVALVMPTFFGPTNIPPLEAFALGCPVVTSDIYGIPEQVGDAALLVNPQDALDIAAKVRLVWENDAVRQRCIVKGYARDADGSQAQFNARLGEIVGLLLAEPSSPYRTSA